MVFFIILLPKTGTAQEITKTSVIVLVDVSGSFFPLQNDAKSALKKVAKAIVKKSSEEWESPVSFLWSTIGDTNEFVYPCGQPIQYDPSKIFRRKDPYIKSSRKKLWLWHDACLRIFSGNRIRQLRQTDLSGALYLAGQSAESIAGLKVLVLLSDFEEAVPANVPSPHFHLTGESVILLYGLSRQDTGNAQRVRSRAEAWSDRIKQAGASKVCLIPVRALQPGRIVQCLDGFSID